jgi:hypothetical protein
LKSKYNESCFTGIFTNFSFFFKQDLVNIIPTTRTSTGNLPVSRQLDFPDSSSTSVFVNQEISGGDMKEKMEQQLRLQREAYNKKPAEDLKQGKMR